MYHLIKVLWQYVVCVINWNNKNSLMLIWTLNYYTYCYIIVSTIFVIKFDSHIFFFFFQGMCKTKNRRTCTWIHWYVNQAVPVLVLILIIIFSFGQRRVFFSTCWKIKYMHVYPFYYDHMGNIYVSLKIPAFLYFV